MKRSTNKRGLAANVSPESGRRGILLIVVLVVIVIMSLAGFSFAALMFTEKKAAVRNCDEVCVENVVASHAPPGMSLRCHL